jgi:uncharacterized membrane protein YgcG
MRSLLPHLHSDDFSGVFSFECRTLQLPKCRTLLAFKCRTLLLPKCRTLLPFKCLTLLQPKVPHAAAIQVPHAAAKSRMLLAAAAVVGLPLCGSTLVSLAPSSRWFVPSSRFVPLRPKRPLQPQTLTKLKRCQSSLTDRRPQQSLLQSAILDMLHFITKENIKSLLAHIAVDYRGPLERMTFCVTPGQLLLQHAKNTEPEETSDDDGNGGDGDEGDGDGSNSGSGSRSSSGSSGRGGSGRGGSRRPTDVRYKKRDTTMDAEEESYWDDEDEAGPDPPTPENDSSSSLTGSSESGESNSGCEGLTLGWMP